MIKVYPRFVGRMGNSMFQIACAIGYAKKYNCDWGIKKGYVERGFNAFQVDKFFPNLPACEDSFPRHQEHKSNSFCKIHESGLDTCWFNYHPIPHYPDGVELAGFFQSYKYFEGADEEIRKAFKLPVWEQYKDYVSIHWRLGDYLQHSESFPPVTVEYFEKAISLFPSDTKFVICSDGIQQCKEQLSHLPIEFSEGHNEFEDLSIMASCKSHIISNSTLAWFGAWLGTSNEKRVISPSHKRGSWFGINSGVRMDCIDLLPNEWEQIIIR